MKILHSYPYFYPAWSFGGAVRAVYDVSKLLTLRGHEVTVYTSDGLDRRTRLIVDSNPTYVDGVRVYYFRNLSTHLLRFNIPLQLKMPIEIRRSIREFDIIHLTGYPHFQNIVLHYYAKKYDIPYVLQAQGAATAFIHRALSKGIFDRLWGRNLLRDASKLVAVSTFEANQYKNLGISTDKIQIIPNGIDLSFFNHLPLKGKFRTKLSMDKDEKIILYLARIHKIKGVDLLVRAFGACLRRIHNATLVVAGPDDGFLPAIKQLIEELHLNDKVILTGPLYGNDKLEAYVDADVYVLPSIYEAFGVTVLEACACGTPVIITNRCGMADAVNNNAGIVVPYDQEKLQEAIIKMITVEGLAKKHGDNARALVGECYNWDKIVTQIEGLYNNVVAAK
ncbi:glycosyltransferase [Chloroflexota bacterium]